MGIEMSASTMLADPEANVPSVPIASPTRVRPSAVYPRPGTGNPKFTEYSSLGDAIHDLTTSVRGVRVGGGTARAGWVLRQLVAKHCNRKATSLFGNYRPSDVAATITGPTFAADATAELEAWQKGWDADVTVETIKARKGQMEGASAFFGKSGFDKVADGISTILAKSASGSVQFTDAATNNRPIGLIGMLDLLMAINLTPSRLAKLGLAD